MSNSGKQQESENAIIIVGNGFDLAHGLETSYNHFAEYLIKEIIVDEMINKPNSPIFSIGFQDSLKREGLVKYKRQSRGSETIFDGGLFVNRDSFLDNVVLNMKKSNNDLDSVSRFLLDNKSRIKSLLSNVFLGKLFANEYENWFDVEHAFYEELKVIYEKFDSKFDKIVRGDKRRELKAKVVNEIVNLNKELMFVRCYLTDYLKRFSDVEKLDVFSCFFKENFKNKKNIYVINFNYTSTFDTYEEFLRKSPRKKVNQNPIHGSLLNSDVIFGYGDDTDEVYAKMKDSKIEEFLECFKTYAYLNENRYNEISYEIELFKDYEVYNLGHSFGATDKTLLSKIISNSKCLNIHLYRRTDFDSKKEYENEENEIKELKKLHYSIARM